MRILALIAFFCSFSLHADRFRSCQFADLPASETTGSFRHTQSQMASWMAARHSANDAVAILGRDAYVSAKLSYGLVFKDLEDERVEMWVDTCGEGLVKVQDGLTDRNGRINWRIPAETFQDPGEYAVWIRVMGDDTRISFLVNVLPEGSKVALLDIDGTLTASEDEIRYEVFADLFNGKYFPEERPYAPELSNFLKESGNYHIVYLTARHHFMTSLTRQWLATKGFANGTLLLAQGISDILPRNAYAGTFKVNEIKKLEAAGLRIGRAYGNHVTDIFAYESAGIAKERTYIVGKNAGKGGTVGLPDGLAEHYAALLSDESVAHE